MANDQDSQSQTQNQEEEEQQEEEEEQEQDFSSSDSDSDSDYDYDDYDYTPPPNAEGDVVLPYVRPGEEPPEWDNTPERNISRFKQILESKGMKEMQEEEERNYVAHEDLYDFPKDRENWKEEDLKELWMDAPLEMKKPGWDPVWADAEDWEVVRQEIKAGRKPPIAPFYVPYRKPYPAIPDNHYDISNPKAVIEELDRIEEFLTWVSYIFPDGSTYEGTVWDDLAHGKGVYVAEQGLVRYEGEWLQNNMEGHGVVEVDIPDIEPVPGSKLEAKMRAEGKIIKRDFMSKEDREWLEMDIEDTMELVGGQYEVPFYENDEWIKHFGRKPEKGRYRYAGQWKHGRMHGCGVYEVNEVPLYGRFYFGEFVEEATDCDENISAAHAGIAEVAAAKARMFVNKPDGMVREQRGPYSDPQHPYFYEEEDVWMAPGFINQFYEVPDYWKRYVQEVDQEREMWLNSFYKAPLRLPMPAELEYWWENEEEPEFVVLNKEPEPDPKDPSKLICTENPLILHTKSGLLINYIEDEEHGVRLFWQPPLKEGEEIDPSKVKFLPLGFDEFYGKKEVVKKESLLERILKAIENACVSTLEKLDKWVEEKKKISEMKIKLLEQELELVEAEICLEEEIEDMEEELKMREKEEGEEEEKDGNALLDQEKIAASSNKDEKSLAEEEGEEEEEEEEEDDVAPSSFGSVNQDKGPTKEEQKGNKPGDSSFAATSLSFASCRLLSAIPSRLQQSILAWKENQLPKKPTHSLDLEGLCGVSRTKSVNFRPIHGQKGRLRASFGENERLGARSHSCRKTSQLHSLSRTLCPSACVKPNPRLIRPRTPSQTWLHAAPERDSDNVLSLHSQLSIFESYSCSVSSEPVSL
ncbi:hypothetical protein K2173_021123 [Erythroxylum novogranatense]|uniref:Ig-like domain-containing protein n=1 Tax=Erythroxylum novogranatense TaxID=1862640 RepID=A0AAV8TQR9_9ROSI|nr:hypothetical protein K2173_021123 [Erythroxylum novogranatense]